jgi:hypothetical protein
MNLSGILNVYNSGWFVCQHYFKAIEYNNKGSK